MFLFFQCYFKPCRIIIPIQQHNENPSQELSVHQTLFQGLSIINTFHLHNTHILEPCVSQLSIRVVQRLRNSVKGGKIYFRSWFQRSQSMASGSVIRQNHHSDRAWRNRAAHLMVAGKPREIRSIHKQNIPFKGTPLVIHSSK